MKTLVAGDGSPLDTLKALPGWNDIKMSDRTKVETEIDGLKEAIVSSFNSRLAIGERLYNIQQLLPYNMFGKFLEASHFKRSTAYKHITSFQNASNWLPKPILKRAAERNMNMLGEKEDAPLGVYTNCVKRLPPPATSDIRKIDEYLDSVEMSRKREIARTRKKPDTFEYDEDDLLKESYRFVYLRMSKLPARGKARLNFVNSLAGMLLSKTGVSSGLTVQPEAVPDDFVARVGRPTKIIEGEKPEAA